MFQVLQKAALTLGLPMLLFLGLRDTGDEAAFLRKTLLAFALLACILLGAGVALWADIGIVWPLVLAVVFLVLLASALFTRSGQTSSLDK